ncbi:MAG: Gfo/Idh/MocA family oxidoreductase [Acidobacteria bacterium]|nr:Gfo/Idh/MocA family oxidoreductase [Acidobacteriota bacterium]
MKSALRTRFFQFSAVFVLLLLPSRAQVGQSPAQNRKIRCAVIGLNHDHVWELLGYLQEEPESDLVAIAEGNKELVEKAKSKVRATVRFYSDYIPMLEEAKPEVVFVTTSNDRHLAILRECARRRIHYSTEKPMATNGADAREMEHLADRAGIKLMVNYWNAWTAPSHDLVRRVRAGAIGPVAKIIVQYGHQGPKEIGVSKQFADWLYDPAKNGGGAIMDFGCYGAEWALWLKGRPSRVYATTRRLKTAQHNQVDDDATLVLDYPDATVIVEPSWDWPYGMDRVYVFGSQGSLLATRNELFIRTASDQTALPTPDGERLSPTPLPHQASNPIAYFLDRIRNDQPVEDPLSARLNVEVVEILDAARESARTGQAQVMDTAH